MKETRCDRCGEVIDNTTHSITCQDWALNVNPDICRYCAPYLRFWIKAGLTDHERAAREKAKR